MNAAVLDLDALARAAAEQAVEKLRTVVRDELRAVLAEREANALEPLDAIFKISKATARGRIARDPELRAIAIPSGRGWVFRREEVLRLAAERKRNGRRHGRSARDVA